MVMSTPLRCNVYEPVSEPGEPRNMTSGSPDTWLIFRVLLAAGEVEVEGSGVADTHGVKHVRIGVRARCIEVETNECREVVDVKVASQKNTRYLCRPGCG